MERKRLITLLAFLVLAAVAAHRQGLFWDSMWSRERAKELQNIQQRLSELADLRQLEPKVRKDLLSTSRAQVAYADVYLPTPGDPLAWASHQIHVLARATGVDVQESAEAPTPRIPARRDETARLFEPYRVRWELKATLGQVIAMVETAQARNPFLHVAELKIYPPERGEERRKVALTLEWPMWADAQALAATRRLAAMPDH